MPNAAAERRTVALHAARSAARRVRAGLARLLDELVPQTCPLCRGPRGPCGCEAFEPLGAAERGALDGAGRSGRCCRCAARVAAPLDGRECRDCRSDPPPFERCVALACYHDTNTREWILRFKHGGRVDLGAVLGARLGRALADAGVDALDGPLVAPVPLHLVRRVERGYDQAHVLARALADELDLACARLLVRRRATAPQGGFSADGRRANVRGAFTLRPRARAAVAGRAVVLVDDVLASGGTARAAARALVDAGAARVWLAVVGRA